MIEIALTKTGSLLICYTRSGRFPSRASIPRPTGARPVPRINDISGVELPALGSLQAT